ncbi:MAG: serine--tRNA ligase, partial [Fidelibacterota bacterium]
MLDLNRIRNQTEQVREGLTAKGGDGPVDRILTVDADHRRLIGELNDLRARRNRASETIGKARREGKDTREAIGAMQAVAAEIKTLEQEEHRLNEELNSLLMATPNLPHASVPRGTSEKDNVVVRTWGAPPEFEFSPRNHLELGTELGLFDFHRGAKIAGSGFPLYTGMGAKLERALINFMIEHHVSNYGFTEIFPPFTVRPESMETTGQLPKFADDMYRVDRDDIYLIPTAEVPVTNIHRDEILEEKELPIDYVAYSACFRREAGSYGKETRGFLRLHQFNKVELVRFVTPDSSYGELEALTAQAESILQRLGLHYRVLALSTGDLSFAAAKCYDLEVWAPGEKQWLEVSSCSNFEDFQARRGRIRYRRSADRKVDFVHTLNGSGVATPRLLVALLETYQTPEG